MADQRRIYKFELKTNFVLMPEGAEIIRVARQCTNLEYGTFIWAIVNINAPKVHRHIVVLATGSILEFNETVDTYIGTFVNEVDEVYHCFDLGERR